MPCAARLWRTPCTAYWAVLASPATRLFFALWPEPETARHIWQATAGLVPRGVGRRLPPEHIHITLAFLGTVGEARQACMEGAAGKITGQPFDLLLDQPGHFPRPQVVWLGVSELPEALQAMQQKLVCQLTKECDYEPEQRAFVPHITLWRKVKRIEIVTNMPPIVWNVRRFVLAASQTLPTGAQYSIVREWPLTTPRSAS